MGTKNNRAGIHRATNRDGASEEASRAAAEVLAGIGGGSGDGSGRIRIRSGVRVPARYGTRSGCRPSAARRAETGTSEIIPVIRSRRKRGRRDKLNDQRRQAQPDGREGMRLKRIDDFHADFDFGLGLPKNQVV